MIVERCWVCLEQPAVAVAELPDGRQYPVCDVCAAEQLQRAEREERRITDEEWARIIEQLR
jgi:hypothetical protein